MFLNASYFDLNVDIETCFNVLSASRSYEDVYHSSLHTWPGYRVRSITTVQDVGETARLDEWIFQRGSFNLAPLVNTRLQLMPSTNSMFIGWMVTKQWGPYRPLLWNCQHFSMMLAQMVIDTIESAETIETLWLVQRDEAWGVAFKRHMGFMAGMGAGFFVPVIGPVLAIGSWASAGVCIAVGDARYRAVDRIFKEMKERYVELQKLGVYY